MFQQILFTQLKWTRTLLLSMAVFTFAVPMLAWNIGGDNTNLAPLAMINGFSMVGPMLVIAAWTLGFLLAALPWGADSQSRHVYALSLPIPWERYVGLRFSAGALTLLIPAISLLLGSLLVLAMIDLPGSLRAYPISLAFRFFLGTLLAYSASFLLQYVAGRRAPMVLLIILVVGLGSFVAVAVFNRTDIVERVVDLLVQWPGPLSIFASEWKLVDV